MVGMTARKKPRALFVVRAGVAGGAVVSSAAPDNRAESNQTEEPTR